MGGLVAQNRKVGATCMNKESSRSHSVFTLYVQVGVSFLRVCVYLARLRPTFCPLPATDCD